MNMEQSKLVVLMHCRIHRIKARKIYYHEEYIELLNAKLVSYKKRKGVISRKIYIELNRKLPEDCQDRVSAWLDDAANADIIQKCLKYLRTQKLLFFAFISSIKNSGTCERICINC
jgi:DNA-dependent RNA polymerase auxiliary subunit epsilon